MLCRFCYTFLTGFSCCSFCKIIFCFFQFCFKICPGFFCIIIFIQSFCCLDRCFQLACVTDRCCFMNIWFFHIYCYSCICISESNNRQLPFTASICSFRKCASLRLCQTKLNTHGFVHPVIRKFGSVSSQWSISISVICPDYWLHFSAKISVVFLQVYTEEISVFAAVNHFNAKVFLAYSFQFFILNTGRSSFTAFSKAECSICIDISCF